MTSLTFHRDHARPRLRLRSDLGLIVAILVLGLALAGLASVILPIGNDAATGAYFVD